MPEAVAILNQLHNPVAIAKVGKLMLPPPQVTDRELENIVKASNSFDEADVSEVRTAFYGTPPHQTSLVCGPYRPWRVLCLRSRPGS